MPTQELSSCPFCGKDGSVDEVNLVGDKVSFYPGCSDPDCFQSPIPYAMRRDAVAAWNKRATAAEGAKNGTQLTEPAICPKCGATVIELQDGTKICSSLIYCGWRDKQQASR